MNRAADVSQPNVPAPPGIRHDLPTWSGVVAAIVIPALAAFAAWVAASSRFDVQIAQNAATIAEVKKTLADMDARQRKMEQQSAQILGILSGKLP